MEAQTGSRRQAWAVVGACIIGLAASYAPTFFMTFSVFMAPISREFGWSRGQLSTLASIVGLAVAVATPFMGNLSGRFGAHRLLLFSTFSFGLSLVGLAVSPGSFAMFAALCVLVGIAGAGTNTFVYLSFIPRWFSERLGLALGVAMTGIGIGHTLMPILSERLIANFGWRGSYLVLATLAIAVPLPGLLRILWHKPPLAPLKPLSRDPAPRAGWIYRDAGFWLLCYAFLMIAVVASACAIHVVPMLVDRGLSSSGAVTIGAAGGVAVLVGRLGAGYLLDLVGPAVVGTVAKAKGVAVRDLELASPPDHRVSGAVYATGAEGLVLDNLALREFRWAALYLEHSSKLDVGYCDIENGATDKDKFHTGAVRSRWLKDSEIHHCRVVTAVGKEYGYKAGGHENVQFHHNYVEVQGEFAVESAHENEYGLDIHHNYLNRCISVPKSGQGDDPTKRKFEYSVRIHHNLLTDSYTVEGPRNHLRLDHNYIRIEKTGGRVYTHHGGVNHGPVLIDHNVVENLDRAFVWKNRDVAEKITVENNTVFCADAGTRAAPVIDGFTDAKQPIADWVVRNNVFVAPKEQPRRLYLDRNEAIKRLTFTNNACVNLTLVPDGNFPDADPGLALKGAKPFPWFAPAGADSLAATKGLGAFADGKDWFPTDIPTKDTAGKKPAK